MADIDVLVIGGGLGGVAAAIAAAESGKSVVLVEPSSWLGGQMTGQGVCTPDEAGINGKTVMNSCGATAYYQKFREWVRNDYQAEGMKEEPIVTGSPGNNWTSNDGFGVEATRAHRIFADWLQQEGVSVFLGANYDQPVLANGVISALTITSSDGSSTTYNPKYVLEATETGDLLPLLGLDWRIGAEANGFQGESNGQTTDEPTWIQPITIPFAVEFQASNIVPTLGDRPDGYDDVVARFKLFDDTPTMWGNYDGFMTYRRVIDHRLFGSTFPNDISMINVASNDYTQAIYPSGDAATDQQTIAGARQLSLCYLYYLQHDAPQSPAPSETGRGWPQIVPKTDFFGTDYIAPLPYVREARRINALGWVLKDDIIGPQSGPVTERARLFEDACGLGNYAMDVHSDRPDHSYFKTNPFQIRASQLVPQDCPNLIASGKCLGVTHVTNGAFRLHPQEWNIGESAGTLAAFCIDQRTTPAAACQDESQLAAYQATLVSRGIPIFWWTDISVDHPQFGAIQMVGVKRIFSGDPGSFDFQPEATFTAAQQGDVNESVGQNLPWPTGPMTRAEAAAFVAQQLNLLPAS